MQRQALYQRWRSQAFRELVGQEHVRRLLLSALQQGRLAHAYLLCGPRGTGKTSTARILAKAANCSANEGRGEPCNACSVCEAITAAACMDVIEIDAASNSSVEDIRDLRDRVGFMPSEGRRKFYIIDEAHRLSKAAFDALLKTLEEPPPHVVFVLASTAPDHIPLTIRSRCQRLDFRPIPHALTLERLATICQSEEIAAEPAALLAIARAGEGSLRDAESLLDQLSSAAPEEGLTLAYVEAVIGIGHAGRSLALVERLAEHDAAGALRLIHELAERGADLVQFGRDVVRALRALLLLAMAGDESGLGELPHEEHERAAQLAARLSAGTLATWVRLFAVSELPQRTLALPQLGLELACVEALAAAAAGPDMGRPAADERGAVASPAHPAPPVRPRGPKPVSDTVRPLSPERNEAVPVGAAPPPALAKSPPAAAAAAIPERPLVAGAADRAASAWPQVLDYVGQRDRRSQAVLRDGKLLLEEGERLVLGFRYDFHRAFFEDPKRRELVEEAIAAVCGETRRVECTRLDIATDPGPRHAVDDRLVQEALASMGGRVKSVSRAEAGTPDEHLAGDEGEQGR